MKSKSYGIWGKYLKVISYIVLTLLITEPVVSQNIQLANDELSYALTERFPNMTIKQDGVRSASLNKIISVQYEEALFMDVLQDIVQNEDFRLSYSDQYLPLEKKVTVDLKNVTVNEALWAILDDTGLRYALSPNNHLVLMKRHQGINQTVIQEAVQETITGTVTDAGTGETLPGVNILVAGTSTGTSTEPKAPIP
ncbi:MAG: secretin and TonB N-terminal domain-containing protein [Balneolales bacterium]